MAKIPEYTKSQIMPRATPQLGDIKDIYRASEPFDVTAQVLGASAQLIEKHQQAKDVTELNAAVIRNKKEKIETLDALRQQNMANPQDFAKNAEEAFNKIDQGYMEGFTSPEVKSQFQQTSQQVNLGFFDDNLKWQNTRQTQIHAENIEQAVSDLSPIAFRYGKEGRGIDDIKKDVDATLVAASTFLPPETTSKMKRKLYGDMTETWLSGMIETNPAQAKRELDSKKYDEALGGDGLKKAYAIIEDKKKKQETEYKQTLLNESADLDIAIDMSEDPREIEALKTRAEKMRGVISPSAYASKVIRANHKLKEVREQDDINQKVTNALTEGGGIDLSGAKESKAVDQAYKAFIETAKDPTAAQKAKVSFVERLGAVPKAMQHELNTNLRSNNPEEVLSSAMTINAIKHARPDAINDVPNDALKLSNQIITNVNLGYDSKKAVAMAKEEKTLDTMTVESRKDMYKTEVKAKSSESYLTDKLNSLFTNDPNEIEPLMIDEFARIAEQEYLRVGDIETARKNAFDLTSKAWGRTEIGGYRYMKNAPEKFYSIANLSPKENRKWIKENLDTDLKAMGIHSERANIGYDPNKANNGAPSYVVTVRDDNGVLNTMIDKNGNPLYWKPDRNFYVNKAKKKREEGLK